MPGRDNYKSVHQIRTELEQLEDHVSCFNIGDKVPFHTFKCLLNIVKEYINTKEMGH